MTEQIPLYLGIPLAILCIGATIFMIMFVVTIWRDRD